MVEKVEVSSSRIRYEGIFDWPALYSVMYDFLSSKKYEFHEVKSEKKPANYGYEMKYEVDAFRKETTYVKFLIKLKILAVNMEDIEVATEEGKKRKNKVGMMIIDLFPIVELNWQQSDKEKMKESKFQASARTFVHKYILRRYIDKWRDKLNYEAYQLQTKIKEELNLVGKYSAYKNG